MSRASASTSLPVGPRRATPRRSRPAEPAGAAPQTVAFPEDAAHHERRRTGQPLPPDWRRRFLEHYAEHGTYWKACKTAGVCDNTVTRHRERDPDFAAQVEAARQEFADSREMNLRRLADNGNVVGDIVLLKKHRPAEYIEKNLTVTASFSTALSPEDGKALLQAMLGAARPSTTQALGPHHPGERQPVNEVLPEAGRAAETRDG